MAPQSERSTDTQCWFGRLRRLFTYAGLRVTPQRRMVALSVFAGDRNRHFSAQEIHRDLVKLGSRLSLATVYNTLNTMNDAGMIQKIPVGDGNFFFDTNRSDHVHVVTENRDGTHNIVDADDLDGAISNLRALAGRRSEATVIRIVL